MPRQQSAQSTSRESRISLAIASYHNNKKQPIRALAKAYDVLKSTLYTRIHDIYNFNETGFAMGVAGTLKVVISSERVGWAVVVQPGNREWVIVIECVNASGWSLLLFVILSGKVY
ncbi:hypothetical protein COCSADRAFT_34769 [Bipolaris sorokiniana ND90Pr]|uniref:HTH psq-type domain-containing protein n=1 Tax=Cochliobolus sativus (strain ND90Pr / ATCC 201652) TaxID=665912 RepID=M2RHI0_COCSN|nr:uncharacterized protein COCSADRAFT_34769 [Bipolaris sorokiniana ND90Pr]EMD66194.1 hypothetical protein COCSADRAFT_34769 [Bipolaris sorokiniana ND90Pr]